MIAEMLWLTATATASLAAVLIVSGLGKAAAPQSVDAAFADLRVPRLLSGPVLRRTFPWIEASLGLGLLVLPGVLLGGTALLVCLLFLAYLVLLVRAQRAPELVRCGCFGAASTTPVTRRTVCRNLVLVALALWVLAGPLAAGVPSWWAVAAEHPGALAAVVPVLLIGGAADVEGSCAGTQPQDLFRLMHRRRPGTWRRHGWVW